MARYIDATQLQAKILDASITNKLPESREVLKIFDKMVQSMPTADVVPRSEVEKLEEHIDDLNDSKEHLAVMLEETRADVAREVFEKIEDQLRGMLDHFRQNYDVRESGAIIVALSKIAELKKKYTEGE